MTVKKLIKTNPYNTPFSELIELETEYNECGGYITGYDANNKTHDVYFNCCSDEVYGLAEELAKHLNIRII